MPRAAQSFGIVAKEYVHVGLLVIKSTTVAMVSNREMSVSVIITLVVI
jgi:hypothetical protein